MAARFGGLTAQTRAPVEGVWKQSSRVKRDTLVIYEVTVTSLERRWWRAFRQRLEKAFRQQEIALLIYKVQKL